MNDLMVIPGVEESLAKKFSRWPWWRVRGNQSDPRKRHCLLVRDDGISLDRAIKMVSEFSGGVENAARNKDGQKLHTAMIHDIEPFISSSPGKANSEFYNHYRLIP